MYKRQEFWKESSNLGVISGLISPTFGGLGGSGEDISIIFELIGKSLCIEPFLSSGILSSTILTSIKRPKTELINQIVDGELLISFAHMEMNNRYEDHSVDTKAFLEDENWKLNGCKSFVINGDSADKVIVSARIDGEINDKNGIGLFLVDNSQIKNRSYNTTVSYTHLRAHETKANLVCRLLL